MPEAILKHNLITNWIQWHFFDAPNAILKAWKNFLKFNLNYFSIPQLLKTFFSHWRRYYYPYGKRFDPARYFEAFTFNMMSRVIGAILRIFFIVTGLLVEVFIFFVGAVTLLIWLILPVLLLAGLWFDFKFLI